jgi:hypothetical protein
MRESFYSGPDCHLHGQGSHVTRVSLLTLVAHHSTTRDESS